MIGRMPVVLALAIPMLAQAGVSAGTFEMSGSGQLGYQSLTIDPDADATSESRTFGLELGGLYYVTPMVGIGAEVFFDTTTSESEGIESKIEASGLVWGVGAGLKYFLAPSFSANVGLNYDSVDLQGDGGSRTATNLFVGIGFSGYFGGR